jgi:hypothetical protein
MQCSSSSDRICDGKTARWLLGPWLGRLALLNGNVLLFAAQPHFLDELLSFRFLIFCWRNLCDQERIAHLHPRYN